MLPRSELDAWVSAYIAYQISPPRTPDEDEHPCWWAVERAMDIVSDSTRAEELWEFILTVLARQPPEQVLGILSAGPLEDLVHHAGPLFIDRIEAESRARPAFRALLAGIWESSTPEVWARVLRATGATPGEV